MEVLLNNLKWKLCGFWPYTPIIGKSMEVGTELNGVTNWIDSSVPGSVYMDLLKAEIIEDPYYEMNSLKCEWVSNRWWMYKTQLNYKEIPEGENHKLIFKGVDYKAHFYFNGKPIGEHEGMYENVIFDITEKIRHEAQNEIIVLIEAAPDEMSQIGYTSESLTQKSRFNYKWDFSTRLVNLGIWDDVILKVTNGNEITETQVSSNYEKNQGSVKVNFHVGSLVDNNSDYIIKLSYKEETINRIKKSFNFKAGDNSIAEEIVFENPELWYPNGYGSQPLYNIEIIVYSGNIISDKKESRVGIRALSYCQNENSSKDSLPYTVIINGIKIYIKGVNMTPIDHMYGCVDYKRYESLIKLMKEGNINLVRVWGGGLIEKDCFYELCDEYGILIWQEFIQSSSGIDNIPSVKNKFLTLLSATAVQAVKDKRNHTSLTVLSGGNELMDKNGVPVNYSDPNIKMLKKIVDELAPEILFLPTSASGPLEFLDPEKKGLNHDVHGPWKYGGINEHYKLFNDSDSLFHSEFGVDGMSNLTAVEKVLDPKNQCVTNMKDNLSWRHHGEWWDTYSRDSGIYSEIKDFESFIRGSQFIQAEGLRYALEANRRRKFQNSGSIVWQLNEPWPNVSSTCIVDYYGFPKLAYHFVKLAYRPIHVSLKYDKLNYFKNSTFKADIYVHNDLKAFQGKVTYSILNEKEEVLFTNSLIVNIEDNSCSRADIIEFNIGNEEMFYIHLKLESCQKEYDNMYVFGNGNEYVFKNIDAIWYNVKKFANNI